MNEQWMNEWMNRITVWLSEWMNAENISNIII